MSKKIKYDFSGYATKNGLKCSDGRVIQRDAFKHNDGITVPLVWQHLHNDPMNVLGHALLENREDGVYTYANFNNTESGKNAKALVAHGDVVSLSIYANALKQKGDAVYHGNIREVSLVLSGANPGALIDYVSFAHADGSVTEDETEAIIYTGLELDKDLKHDDEEEEEEGEVVKHAEKEGKTIQDVFDTLNEEQKNVVYAMIGLALEEAEDGEAKHSDDEGEVIMKKNIFEQEKGEELRHTALSADQVQAIMADAKRCGSLKEAFLAHAAEYGIEDIEILFPDAKSLTNTPDFVKRDDSWVAGVMADTHHVPFSRIKSVHADITEDEARAKGYITGNRKKEEVFPVMKRATTPTTVYKKQKLDRDDIIDITDFDVVAWLKMEMRWMLNEELARAFLIGDGRDVSDEDHINTANIRPIWTDDEFYSHKVRLSSDTTPNEMIEAIIRARKHYKGAGNPVFYTTNDVLADMLLIKDKMDRRIYNTVTELAAVLRVSKIVEVEVMEGAQREVEFEDEEETRDLIGIIVNLRDYKVGADKGGQVAMFDDFDIDYNQYKYLMETRCSGALTKWKSALVIERVVGEEVEE